VVWGDIADRRAVESAVHEVEAVIHLTAMIPPMADQNPKKDFGVLFRSLFDWVDGY